MKVLLLALYAATIDWHKLCIYVDHICTWSVIIFVIKSNNSLLLICYISSVVYCILCYLVVNLHSLLTFLLAMVAITQVIKLGDMQVFNSSRFCSAKQHLELVSLHTCSYNLSTTKWQQMLWIHFIYCYELVSIRQNIKVGLSNVALCKVDLPIDMQCAFQS